MRTVLILMGCLLTVCAWPETALERPYHPVEYTDPTRSRSEYKDVSVDMAVPPGAEVLGTRIGWSNMPDPNTYWVSGKQVNMETKVEVETKDESIVSVEGEDC